jgi:hypothetical protein
LGYNTPPIRFSSFFYHFAFHVKGRVCCIIPPPEERRENKEIYEISRRKISSRALRALVMLARRREDEKNFKGLTWIKKLIASLLSENVAISLESFRLASEGGESEAKANLLNYSRSSWEQNDRYV